jgi:hypothetical protein
MVFYSVLEASCDMLSARHYAGNAGKTGSDAVALLCDTPAGRSPRVSLGYIKKGFAVSGGMDGLKKGWRAVGR